MRLLICDDHRLFAESLGLALELRGHIVEVVTDTPAAVAAVEIGGYDVCLMDLFFPEGDSLLAIEAVSTVAPDTKVVVLSGCTEAGMMVRATAAGAVGFVSKDEGMQRIMDIIDRAHRGEPLIAGPVLREALRARLDPRDPVQRLIADLTVREREVLDLLVRGEHTQAIARSMNVTYATARTHIQNVLGKLGVHSRLEAVALAVKSGLVSPSTAANTAPLMLPGRAARPVSRPVTRPVALRGRVCHAATGDSARGSAGAAN